jgi:hypothetical protein
LNVTSAFLYSHLKEYISELYSKNLKYHHQIDVIHNNITKTFIFISFLLFMDNAINNIIRIKITLDTGFNKQKINIKNTSNKYIDLFKFFKIK